MTKYHSFTQKKLNDLTRAAMRMVPHKDGKIWDFNQLKRLYLEGGDQAVKNYIKTQNKLRKKQMIKALGTFGWFQVNYAQLSDNLHRHTMSLLSFLSPKKTTK